METPQAFTMYSEVHCYQRISTPAQSFDRQESALQRVLEAYPDYIGWKDVGSGGDRSRKSLLQMKGFLSVPTRMPKLVIIYEIDRLFRDLTGALNFIETFVLEGNTHLYIVKEGLYLTEGSTMVETNRMMFVVLAMFAEMERRRIASRTMERMQQLKTQGKVFGRPRDTSLDIEIQEYHFQGKSMYWISKKLKISHSKVKRSFLAMGLE